MSQILILPKLFTDWRTSFQITLSTFHTHAHYTVDELFVHGMIVSKLLYSSCQRLQATSLHSKCTMKKQLGHNKIHSKA